MTDLQHAPVADDVDEPAGGSHGGRSLAQRIKARHERRSRHLDLPLPEYDGDVVVRYRRIDPKTLRQAAKAKGPRAGNARLLVAACHEVLLRDDEGRLHPASEEDGLDAPVRFDGRLADMFEMQGATDPIDICIRMYADDVALAAHAKALYDWQTGEDLREIDDEEVDELVGEAPAAT